MATTPRALLQPGNDWDTLYVPPEVMQADSIEKVHVWKEIETALLKKYAVRGAKTSLHSFVVSNTPMGSVRWWKLELASWEDFADRHVLFQKESTGNYISEIFQRSFVC